MLRKRFTEPMKIVSLNDDAVSSLPMERLREYFSTRRYETLIDDRRGLPKLDEARACIITARPLAWEYDHMADQSGIVSDWIIFATHVIDIANPPDGNAPAFVEQNGQRRISDAYRDALPPEVIREIAQVIREAPSRGYGSLPFSPPATDWERLTILAQIRHAMHAERTARDATM